MRPRRRRRQRPGAKVATVSFHKFRGPGQGDVRQGARRRSTKQGDMVSATATFDAAGRLPAARAGQRRIG